MLFLQQVLQNIWNLTYQNDPLNFLAMRDRRQTRNGHGQILLHVFAAATSRQGLLSSPLQIFGSVNIFSYTMQFCTFKRVEVLISHGGLRTVNHVVSAWFQLESPNLSCQAGYGRCSNLAKPAGRHGNWGPEWDHFPLVKIVKQVSMVVTIGIFSCLAQMNWDVFEPWVTMIDQQDGIKLLC